MQYCILMAITLILKASDVQGSWNGDLSKVPTGLPTDHPLSHRTAAAANPSHKEWRPYSSLMCGTWCCITAGSSEHYLTRANITREYRTACSAQLCKRCRKHATLAVLLPAVQKHCAQCHLKQTRTLKQLMCVSFRSGKPVLCPALSSGLTNKEAEISTSCLQKPDIHAPYKGMPVTFRCERLQL